MRVISGSARGTVLHSIEDINTRPTLDRVKESLFNIIQNRYRRYSSFRLICRKWSNWNRIS